METWGAGLGNLYPAIGPVDLSGRTATLGIELSGARIATSWYSGTKELPAVVDLPQRPVSGTERLDWPTLSSELVPQTRAWAWFMTKRTLATSLLEALQSGTLALESTDAVHELSWEFALAVNPQGRLNQARIRIQDVLRYIGQEPSSLTFFDSDGQAVRTSGREFELLRRYLEGLQESGEEFIVEPWPSEDLSKGSGKIWGFYSKERLLERTNAVYTAALNIYKNMTDSWFKAFDKRLRLYQLLPVRLEGYLAFPVEPDTHNRGPQLSWHTCSLLDGAESTSAIELGPNELFEGDFFASVEEEEGKLKRWRPDSAITPFPVVAFSLLDVFGSRPATRIAHDWLIGELRELGWAET